MSIKKCRDRQEGTVTPSSRSTTTEGNSKQSDSEELQQFSRHVESEVARWQHEINQTEQQWFKKLQSNKPENDNSAFITSTRGSDVTHEATCMIVTKPGTNKPKERIELPHVADITRKFDSIVSDENKLLGTNKDTVKHQSSIKETNAVNIISKTFEKPPKVPIKETVRKSKLSKNCEKRQKSSKAEITSVSVISKNFEKSLQVLKEDNSRRNNTRQDIITKSRSCESVLTLPMLGKGMETKVPVTPYPRPPCVLMETLKANGDSPMMNGNSRKWEVDSSRSEGSTVSSDSEFSPRLPSVKELSKHFSGGTDSDSSTSASKGLSPSPRLKGTDLCTAMKEVVIITKEDQLKEHQQQHYHLATPPTRPVRQNFSPAGVRGKLRSLWGYGIPTSKTVVLPRENIAPPGPPPAGAPGDRDQTLLGNTGLDHSTTEMGYRGKEMRLDLRKFVRITRGEVHSLTARSMTREFREGLRRNFPVAMDRNVYNTAGSDSSLTGAKSPVNGRDGYDTTPGYTSDESGTVSPVPAPGQMRNNIAFWEQMNNSK
uniref:Uncharacterized protein n=1 Tax=Timema monikensis TaxID=170555 RepID=A0A7R9EHN0_9NEOP|nr:unnamed protein product [Timema monikensis]